MMKRSVSISLVVALIIIAGIVAYALGTRSKDASESPQSETSQQQVPSQTEGIEAEVEVIPTPQPTEPTQPEAPKQKGFTMSDVSQHAVKTDCWVVIDGAVYDVTSLIAKHPGGQDPIVASCGQDASSKFATKGNLGMEHSAKAKATLATYKIGVLATE